MRTLTRRTLNILIWCELTIVVKSYFYTAMAILIPESFDWNTRPLVSQGKNVAQAWSQMNNSDGTIPPPPPAISLDAIHNSAGTYTYGPEGTRPAASDVAPFTSLGDITFAPAADTAHTSTENCFTFLPSASVQGRPSEVCDCGSTTAALTTQGAITGCALGNSFVTLNQFPTPTAGGFSTTSNAPMVTTPKRMYPKAHLTKTIIITDSHNPSNTNTSV